MREPAPKPPVERVSRPPLAPTKKVHQGTRERERRMRQMAKRQGGAA